ncbi:hypothetical protein [Paucibacter sp. Y2R2-4]|uniref:hypothetical protein n=1 Tax=Paucibacter sp. Y2R2-4 TaxID=2893553 RepID=UPI0021E3DB5B|nr:hypothetical protein [Paucibacter sp. Y2R2-4]MCV2352282.1 hypothetical protein [Paucibacter sp. Y2R2-4]
MALRLPAGNLAELDQTMTPTRLLGQPASRPDTAAINAWFANLRPCVCLRGHEKAEAALLMMGEPFPLWMAANHPERLSDAAKRLMRPSPEELTRSAALSLAGIESLALLDTDPEAQERFARRVAGPFLSAR